MHISSKRALAVLTSALVVGSVRMGQAQDVESQPAATPSTTQQPATVTPEKKPDPFAFADFTWLSGNPRTKESPIDTKVFTGEFRVDTNFTYSFNKPIDDTIGGSSEIFRSGEFQITQLGIGGDFHYDNVQGRLMKSLFGEKFVVSTTNVSPSQRPIESPFHRRIDGGR